MLFRSEVIVVKCRFDLVSFDQPFGHGSLYALTLLTKKDKYPFLNRKRYFNSLKQYCLTQRVFMGFSQKNTKVFSKGIEFEVLRESKINDVTINP